jgi:inhibitor of KinA
MITIHSYGESALLVNFEQRIDREIHKKVVALSNTLRGLDGITYMVPAYCSLTVVYDRNQMSYQHLKAYLQNLEEAAFAGDMAQTGRQITIPVCYEKEYALDALEVCSQTGHVWERIIDAHQATEFYVYMLGFMPGFAYMGDMPRDYFCRRKAVPRTLVPAGSVGLGGLQSAIYPYASPGGWQIIGKTPLQLFDPAQNAPNLLESGDCVRFERISVNAFENYSA